MAIGHKGKTPFTIDIINIKHSHGKRPRRKTGGKIYEFGNGETENLQRMVKNAEEKYAKKGEVALADLSSALQGVITGKADAATTLAGYGITDAMTAEQIGAAISGAVSSVYKPGGSAAFDSLPELSAANLGKVVNVTDGFTTTADFVEGAGKTHPAGTNVVIVDTDTAGESPSCKYDVLAGFVDLSGYSTTEQMTAAISAAIAGLIKKTDISAETTGTGNVITGASYDSSTGKITFTKGLTALTEDDFVEYTDAQIDALWNPQGTDN